MTYYHGIVKKYRTKKQISHSIFLWFISGFAAQPSEKLSAPIYTDYEEPNSSVVQQQQNKAKLASDKCPIVLVSFSMPDNQLKALITEAHKVGAVVAIRGLVNDDFKQTLIKLRQLTNTNTDSLEQGNNSQIGGIIIDPTLFRRFSVSTVPTFILPLESLQPCTEQGCVVPEHVQATGSATLKYFLDLVARTGSKAEQQAAQVWLAK